MILWLAKQERSFFITKPPPLLKMQEKKERLVRRGTNLNGKPYLFYKREKKSKNKNPQMITSIHILSPLRRRFNPSLL